MRTQPNPKPIPVKYNDIDFDIANLSRNLASKHRKKENNRLTGAKIGQKVNLNKLIFSCGP